MSRLSQSLKQEITLSWVSLMRLPGFCLTVILTLAITLAALIVVLNINYLVLTKPLPYPDANNLLVTDQSETIKDDTQYGYQLLPTQFHIYNDETYIDEMALIVSYGDRLRDIEGTPYIDGSRVSPEYFSLLGMPMHLGRHFNENEGLNDRQTVAVLSYHAWQQYFKADLDIVGKFTRVGNYNYQIVGVAAPEFQSPEIFGHFADEMWLSFPNEVSITSGWNSITSTVNGIAKLKSGVSIAQANQTLGQQIDKLYQSQEGVAADTSIGAQFVPLKEKIVGRSTSMALLLLAGVVTLLFIAVTNITNLFLSRAAQKQRTMAIQSALGANTKHLFVSMFSEAMILISLAWIVGLLAAGWVMVWLENDLQYMFPRMQQLQLDIATIAFSFVICVVVALVMAKLAIKQIDYFKLSSELQSSGKGVGAQISSLTRHILIATQVMLATFLLLGATSVLSPAIERILKPVGFNMENVDYLLVDYGTLDEGRFDVATQIKSALIALPEVEDAARTFASPLRMGWENYLFDKDNEMLGIVSVSFVDSNHFSVIDHTIMQGRGFSELNDPDNVPAEIIISNALAKRIYGEKSAVGEVLHVIQNTPLTVVGVVSDIYVPEGNQEYATERYYLPFEEGSRMGFSIKLKAPIDKKRLTSLLKDVNPNLSIAFQRSLHDQLQGRLRGTKLTAILTVCLISLALALAGAGIFGVLSYTVQMRRFELGIHLSLGAHTQQVIAMVLKQSLKPIVIGVIGAIGLATICYYGAAALYAYQFKVNLLAFSIALPVMLLIAIMACYLPIKNVVAADPIKALRNE